MNEVNKKLAKWAGIPPKTPHGEFDYVPPNFTESLDACFEWLVPKLFRLEARIILGYSEFGSYARIENALKEYDTKDTAEFYKLFGDTEFEALANMGEEPLAFCRATEKLIDGEK